MDLKILRQDVCQNKTVFNRSAEQSIDIDFILPDYYPPVNKVLKCKTMPRITACAINGQTLTGEGTLNILLMYVSNENEVCSYEHIFNFTKSFELDGNYNDCIPRCHAKEEYMNCRLINERKVELHGALGITAKANKKQVEKVVCDIDGGNVVVNRGVAPATNLIGMAEKYLNIEEDLELGSGQPSVRYLLRYDARAFNVECKIISGKIVAKGEMAVMVLYCGEDNATPQTLKASIPFSQIIDVEGVSDECECECYVDIVGLEIKPRTSVTGETRNITVCAKLRFSANATCNNDVPVIYDAFSTKYESDITLNDMVFEKIIKSVNDKFVSKSNIDLSVSGINSVIDLWCEPNIDTCGVSGEEIKANVEMRVCMIITDKDNNPVYLEKSFQFDYCYPYKNAPEGSICRATAAVCKTSYTILNDNCLEVTAEVALSVTVINKIKLSLVTDAKIDEECKKENCRDCAMIIYYAAAGERVWDIARKYNSSPDEIADINCVEGGCIDQSKPLLIPIK